MMTLSTVPPRLARTGGKFRRYLFIGLLLAAAAGTALFLWLGRFMAREDPLAPADAIFVLAGTRVERPLEAADLYLEQLAPAIVLTRATPEPGLAEAGTRGVRLPDALDTTRTLLTGLGVPDKAVIVPERIHDNTAQEAETLRAVAVAHGWRRVIVVSSKYHLRRAGLACRRALRGTGVEVIMHASRYDPAAPSRWWRRRSDIRQLVSEAPKLLGYAIGIGG